ncbi:MAG: bifunctional glycosyltransferase family 2/GtrA family protein [Intestinibacter bartlettii]|uniref:bifunctional glycosyltransferase family 2/GtrA family protein n=1 Tax=Intestinibacter bartlettii TaxID=261299 RepID=UPI0026F10970|nr:bifunctional glycosyltransferase family 2/GtrA family protein [Intestinibacter bartlettii]MDO5011184.1 bifunctional glycosyltransferase family 2/GtrA family protein [Intestinibacter bartlettii]
MNSRNISIIIPAYEPDDKMINLIKKLKKILDASIVVVDDGSSRKCEKIFEQVQGNAIVLKHKENRGKGAAIKTGLIYINDNLKETECIVTVDADGQHKPYDVKKVCENLIKYKKLFLVDKIMVIGSRCFTGNVPFRSKFGNTMTRYIYKVVSRISIWDTQSGLRAFSFDMIPFLLNIKGDRYEYEINVLLEAAKNNIKINEITIKTVYIANNKSSHFRTIRDSALIYKEILKFSISSFISFLLDYFMYTLLNIITQNIVISNIFARIVSASFNFNMNKKYVYESKNNIWKEAMKYLILATFILLINTTILNFIVSNTIINAYIAKIMVEVFLFCVSYLVQKKLIFYGDKEEAK